MSSACLQSEVGRVLVAGSGFLADGYDLYVVGEVEKVLEHAFVCGKENGLEAPDCISPDEFTTMLSWVSSAALWGAVAGQIIFGSLADKIGRRIIFIVTGTLIVIGDILSGSVQTWGMGPKTLLWQLVIFRGILGFGIGGEYPLSATICAEGTPPERRATMMSLVFANQGLGYLYAASVMAMLAYLEAPLAVFWRLPLLLGAVTPCISLFFRMKMHESNDFAKVKAARFSGDDTVGTMATARRYAYHVVGTAGNWLIFDIVFYANSLFNAEVTSILEVGPGGLKSAMLRTLITVLMALPGYFVGVCFINKLGRKNTQMQGYVLMFIWFGVCGVFYDALKGIPSLFLTVYALTFFFANFGPNLTTYVIPGEIFPTQAKATLHGFSAASGTVGAAIGAMFMPHVTGGFDSKDTGIKVAMNICAGLALAGLVLTIFLTPRYGPEDLEPQEPGETVGFVPLFFQRKQTQSEWMKEQAEFDDFSDDDDDSDGETE